MAKRRLSDLNVYVSAAVRSMSPRTPAEARDAFRAAMARWRADKGRRESSRRRNPPDGASASAALACPHCNARLTVPSAQHAGDCPRCGTRVRVVR